MNWNQNNVNTFAPFVGNTAMKSPAGRVCDVFQAEVAKGLHVRARRYKTRTRTQTTA